MKINLLRKITGLLVVLTLGVLIPSISGAAGEWVQKNSGATPRLDHSAAVHNGKMYIFGGADSLPGNALNDLWEYDIETDSWAQKTSGPPSRDCHAAVVYNDKMYIFGGWHLPGIRLNDIWEYGIATDSWNQKTSGATGRNNHTAVVYNGKMYVFGGEDNNHTTMNDLWEYDIATDSWAQKTSAPVARRAHTAVVHDANMYIFGGSSDNDSISNHLWRYDFASDSWSLINGAPFLRADHTAVVHDDEMYIFGGAFIDAEENVVSCNDLWVYDFVNQSWTQQTTIGAPPSERYAHSAVLYNEKMYVFGGNDEHENYFNDLWEYDTDTCALNGGRDRGHPGMEVTIPITVASAPNDVASLGFDVSFDPSVLQYTGYTRGNLVQAFDFFDVSTPESGLLRVGGFEAGADTIAEGASGTLVELRFLVIDCVPQDTSDLPIDSLKDDLSGWPVCPGRFICGCLDCGDVNLDDDLTPGDALLAFQHYLGIAEPPLDPCQLDQADVTQDDDITPADALCIFQKYLAIPSCLDGRPECPWDSP